MSSTAAPNGSFFLQAVDATAASSRRRRIAVGVPHRRYLANHRNLLRRFTPRGASQNPNMRRTSWPTRLMEGSILVNEDVSYASKRSALLWGVHPHPRSLSCGTFSAALSGPPNVFPFRRNQESSNAFSRFAITRSSKETSFLRSRDVMSARRTSLTSE